MVFVFYSPIFLPVENTALICCGLSLSHPLQKYPLNQISKVLHMPTRHALRNEAI